MKWKAILVAAVIASLMSGCVVRTPYYGGYGYRQYHGRYYYPERYGHYYGPHDHW